MEPKKKTQNITSQNCDEDHLRLLSSCVEQSSEGVAVADLAGKLLFLNRAFANTHGYEPDELVGKHLSILHTPEQMPQVNKANAITQKTGTFSGEIWHLHKDGHIFPTHMSNTLRRDNDGNPIGMIASLRDITDLKEVENALRQSENHFRTIFQTRPDAISISRLEDGLYIDANEVFLAAMGFDRLEVIGHSSTELEHWHNLADRKRLVEALKRTGRMDNLEAKFRTKSGGLITGLLSAQVIDLQGELCIIAVIRDITDRKRAEEELKKARGYSDRLIQTASAIVVSLDCNGDIDVFNKAAEEITGYAREELEGRNWFETIVPRERYPEVWTEFERLMLGGLPEKFENPILTKSGEERYIVWRNSELIQDGETCGTISFGVDITDRKQAEENLRQTTAELQNERQALTDKNIALKQILDHIEQERLDYKDAICRQVDDAIRPLLHKLKGVAPTGSEAYIEGLELSLEAILAKDVDVFQGNYSKLTPREIEICELIKEGKSSKQISDVLNLSLLTVHKHREQIRDKLELTNKSINLSSFLKSH